jgi:hypothetical protein
VGEGREDGHGRPTLLVRYVDPNARAEFGLAMCSSMSQRGSRFGKIRTIGSKSGPGVGLTASPPSCDGPPAKIYHREGSCYGDRHREMVQQPEGLWVHRPLQWWPRCIRPHLDCRAGRALWLNEGQQIDFDTEIGTNGKSAAINLKAR